MAENNRRFTSTRTTYGRAAALALATVLAVSAPAVAAEKDDIQSMIRDQIAAFHGDDGEAAFAHASPQIQSMFGDPDRFMIMVRAGYAPIYRARSVTFGDLIGDEDARVQPVYLVGPKGKSWVAAYAVQQQDDGSWRITGVQLAPDTGSAI